MIEIRGVRYGSVAEAARAHGVHVRTIYNARQTGTLDNVGRGRKKPITIRGVRYESRTAAAAALGMNKITVKKYRTTDSIGLGRGRNGCRPVIVDGEVFPSQQAACARFGWAEDRFTCVKARFARPGEPHAGFVYDNKEIRFPCKTSEN